MLNSPCKNSIIRPIWNGGSKMQTNKKETTGYLLAFLLGGIGAHHFYYRNYLRGILYLLFCWTGIPIILGWIDMIFVKKWTARENGHTQVNNTAKSRVENRTEKPKAEPKEITNSTSERVSGDTTPPKLKERIFEDEFVKEVNIKDVAPITTSPADEAEKLQENTAMKKTVSFIKDAWVFYRVEDIILPEYEHLKTPKHISDELNRIKSPKKTTSRHDGFEITISYGHHDEEFVKDSMKNAVARGTLTKEIPFQSYWPTFSNLDKPRLRWYLYWREQALKGNYLEVDLSYIFIFVYELINYSFNRNAAFNVSMMVRLLDNYKEQHPKLSNYMNEWIADMLYELEEDELAAAWSKKQTQTPKLYQVLEEGSVDLSSLPINIWKPYTRTKRETEFYTSHKAKINKKFKQSLPLIEKTYVQEGATLIEKWFEVKKVRTIRHLYKGAVIGRNREPIHVYFTEYQATEELKNIAHNLLRLSENVVRLQSGEKRQIKVDEDLLPEGLKEEMMHLSGRFKKVQEKSATSKGSSIPAAPPGEKAKDLEIKDTEPAETTMEFNWQEIEEKNKALRDLQARIDDGEEEEIEEVNNDLDISSTSSNTEPSTVPSDVSIDEVLGDDEEDIAEFVSSMSTLEKEFISRFEDLEMVEETAKSFAKDNSTMLGFFLTKLNEKANQHLGDTLVEETEEGYEIIEDYEDVVLMVRSVGVEN